MLDLDATMVLGCHETPSFALVENDSSWTGVCSINTRWNATSIWHYRGERSRLKAASSDKVGPYQSRDPVLSIDKDCKPRANRPCLVDSTVTLVCLQNPTTLIAKLRSCLFDDIPATPYMYVSYCSCSFG